MKRFLIGLCAAFALAACSNPAPTKAPRPTHETKSVYVLPTGQYTYQGDDGTWWYYSVLNPANPLSPLYAANQTSATSGLPSGGSWARGAAPTQQQLSDAEQEQVEVAEGLDGDPISEAEFDALDSAADVADAAIDVDATEATDTGSADTGGDHADVSDTGGHGGADYGGSDYDGGSSGGGDYGGGDYGGGDSGGGYGGE